MDERLPDNFKVMTPQEYPQEFGDHWELDGATEAFRIVLEDQPQLMRRKNELTKELLDSTCSTTNGNYTGVTLLNLACLCKAMDSVLILLEMGADPNKGAVHRDGRISFPLANASWHGSLEVSEILIDYGASVDVDPGGGLIIYFDSF